MSYRLMSDEEVLKDLAKELNNLRISKKIKESEIEESTGISRKTLYNFRKGTTSLSLKNFIRLLRAFGELDRLEFLFNVQDSYSPMGNSVKELPKRVRDKSDKSDGFKWGDER